MSARSYRKTVWAGCKNPTEMAAKCTTDAQRNARLRRITQMIWTNEKEIMYARQRIAAHHEERCLLEQALNHE